MLSAARVTLRKHRFEISAAVVVALAAAALGLSIWGRIGAVSVSQECIERVRALADSADDNCYSQVQAGSAILGETYLDGEGTITLSVMGVLPFLLGLLGGVPIVARELESGTAQTAWWLTGSRTRWLAQHIIPVAVVLGLAMVPAAVVAGAVAEHWVRWGHGGAAELIGSHGVPAVVRAGGAFGVGVIVGALLGRTLPAFVVSAGLILALSLGVSQIHDVWLKALPAEIIADESGALLPRTKPTGWGWIDPDGELISQAQARAIVDDAGVPPAEPGDVQDVPAMTWLDEQGYRGVPLGVSDESAMAWAPFDGLIFGTTALIGLAGAFIVVNRRRLT